MNSLTILLCFALFVGLTSSTTTTFNKTLTTDPATPISPSCVSTVKTFKPITTQDINLTVDNEFLNLVPLDVCGVLVGSTTPISGCDSAKPNVTLTFKANEATESVTKVVTIENGSKTFCAHLSPCELLSLLKKGAVQAAQLTTAKISVSGKFFGQFKASSSLRLLAEEPSWKLSFVGSQFKMSNTATSSSEETFVGSIAAIRHKSACNSKDCALTIGELKNKVSNFLKYTKGSAELPECVDQTVPESQKLNANLTSVIDYFRVGIVNDKLPENIKYKVVSSLPTPSTTTTTKTTTTTTTKATTTTTKPSSSSPTSLSFLNGCLLMSVASVNLLS